MPQGSKGFTLIELLIVIVIIGILAGVTIGIVNPTAQQNKARDANIKAAMNKIVLAVEAHNSAYGATPTDVAFMSSVSNVNDYNTSCNGGDKTCYFSITGITLPSTCAAASGIYGNGAAQCYWEYYGGYAVDDPTNYGTQPTLFAVWAKTYGLPNTLLLYFTGHMYLCTTTATSYGNCVQQ